MRLEMVIYIECVFACMWWWELYVCNARCMYVCNERCMYVCHERCLPSTYSVYVCMYDSVYVCVYDLKYFHRIILCWTINTFAHMYVCMYIYSMTMYRYMYVIYIYTLCLHTNKWEFSTVFNVWFVPVYYWNSVGATPIYFSSRSTYMHTYYLPIFMVHLCDHACIYTYACIYIYI